MNYVRVQRMLRKWQYFEEVGSKLTQERPTGKLLCDTVEMVRP